MNNRFFIMVALPLVISCQSNSTYKANNWAGGESEEVALAEDRVVSGDMSVTRLAPPKNDGGIDLSGQENSTQKKTIKDGTLHFEVAELEKAKKWIDSILAKYNGYYANEVLSNTDYVSTYELKIRVPNINFELFVKELEEGKGKVTYKHINARDVTAEFIDLETRLENKRNYLDRYRDLLKKANSIKEILEVEEKIRVLEEEIESVEGRLKYLGDQVDFSTLNITLAQEKEYKYDPVKRENFGERLKRTLSKGWFGFIDFILAFLRIWPFWIILGAGFYIWRYYRKKKKSISGK